MTASRSVAEDVTQETFLAVMRDAARYDPARATTRAWLCGIARNFVRRHFDRDRQLQPLDEGENDEQLVAVDTDPLGELTRAEAIDAVREAVLTLPVRYREAVVLCDLQELSYVEAAAAVGCAVGTVRSRLHRARALLVSKLTGTDVARRLAAGFSQPHGASDSRRTDAPSGVRRTGPGRIEFARAPSTGRNLA
jgi:RNA polymerase sigma-70 factor (ECF subfamily)